MRSLFFVVVLVFVLAGCSSVPTENRALLPGELDTSSCQGAMSMFGGGLPELAAGEDEVVERFLAESKVAWDGKVPPMTDVEDYLDYMSALDQAGRSVEANQKIKGFLAKNPEEKRAVFLLAVNYYRLKKKEMARHLFEKLEKDPGFNWKAQVYNNLGMLALEDKNRLAALGWFEKAVADATSPAPYVNLGALYVQGQNYAAAETLFNKALSMDDQLEEAALGLGVALEGQGKYEEAHKIYADYQSASPEGLSLLYNDAVVLGNRLGKKSEAAQVMLRYIQKGGKDSAKAHELIRNWR